MFLAFEEKRERGCEPSDDCLNSYLAFSVFRKIIFNCRSQYVCSRSTREANPANTFDLPRRLRLGLS